LGEHYEQTWYEVEPSLYEQPSSVDEAILERLREIEARMAAVEARLETIETRLDAGETADVHQALSAVVEAMGREVDEAAHTRF
jgi:hypothetical protein